MTHLAVSPETGMEAELASCVRSSALKASARQASLSVRRLTLVGSSLHRVLSLSSAAKQSAGVT